MEEMTGVRFGEEGAVRMKGRVRKAHRNPDRVNRAGDRERVRPKIIRWGNKKGARCQPLIAGLGNLDSEAVLRPCRSCS